MHCKCAVGSRKFVVRFLARVCRRELPESEGEAEGEKPAEDQPWREDDLNSPVSGVKKASGSTGLAVGFSQIPRFDSGDSQADDELYIGPASAQDHTKEAQDRDIERLCEAGAVQITEAPLSSSKPASGRRRGLHACAPKPDNESEVLAEERTGFAVPPIRAGGNFTVVRERREMGREP